MEDTRNKKIDDFCLSPFSRYLFNKLLPVQSKGSGRYFVVDDCVRHKVLKLHQHFKSRPINPAPRGCLNRSQIGHQASG